MWPYFTWFGLMETVAPFILAVIGAVKWPITVIVVALILRGLAWWRGNDDVGDE